MRKKRSELHLRMYFPMSKSEDILSNSGLQIRQKDSQYKMIPPIFLMANVRGRTYYSELSGMETRMVYESYERNSSFHISMITNLIFTIDPLVDYT